MAKNNTNKTAFDNIINSAKSESKAVKNIIESQTSFEVKSTEPAPTQKENQENKLVIKPVMKETRSKKTNILLTPTLDKLARAKAQNEGVSLNEVVNQLLEIWVNN